MDQAKRDLPLLKLLREMKALGADPFVLIDAGCSGGVDQVWYEFGEQLIAHGLDPQQSEIERLQSAESHPGVKYHAGYAGLLPSDPFVIRKQAQQATETTNLNPWSRLSTAHLIDLKTSKAPAQSNPIGEDLVAEDQLFGISEFVKSLGLDHVDFIKIDVDGPDMEVLVSSENIVRSHSVLGFAIEANYTGSHTDTASVLHNTDRKMRELGFILASLGVRHYSRKDLPAPFCHYILGQTTFGQPLQGDWIYLRDMACADYRNDWGDDPPASRILKMAALYEIFGLPDMAAEILNVWEERISKVVGTGILLDALTPPLKGRQLSYKEYMRAFQETPEVFFPEEQAEQAPNLEQLNQENKELARRLAAIENSTSWKITSPLRRFVSLLRGLTGKIT